MSVKTTEGIAFSEDVGEASKNALSALCVSVEPETEDLPILDVLLKGVPEVMTLRLNALCKRDLNISSAHTEQILLESFLSVLPEKGVKIKFNVGTEDDPQEEREAGLLMLDANVAFLLLDLLLGGSGEKIEKQDRSLTILEKRLLAPSLQAILGAIEEAVNKGISLHFTPYALLDDEETIERRGSGFHMKLAFSFKEESGEIFVILPTSFFTPFRRDLMGSFPGEKLGHDHFWETHLRKALKETSVEIAAVFYEKEVSLKEMQLLEEGGALAIEAHEESVELRCHHVRLSRGHVGNRNGHVAIKLLDPIHLA